MGTFDQQHRHTVRILLEFFITYWTLLELIQTFHVNVSRPRRWIRRKVNHLKQKSIAKKLEKDFVTPLIKERLKLRSLPVKL